MSEYLTTKELADLLRIKERKVYDLAASGDVPCSRATGKLLFPRRAVEAWLAENSTGLAAVNVNPRPAVVLGSHDPLLDWALRESRSGLASFFDGSLDGLDRFADREGVATGLHVFDAETDSWNVPSVAGRFSRENVVLVEWAVRQRGLVMRDEDSGRLSGLADLKGARIVPRQPEAGSQHLFEHLMGASDLSPGDVTFTSPVRNESDAALAVSDGDADAAFGLAAMAEQFRLHFVPLVTERFDLLVDRQDWFDAPMQTLLEFCRGQQFAGKAATMRGYDVSGFGRVHFNA